VIIFMIMKIAGRLFLIFAILSFLTGTIVAGSSSPGGIDNLPFKNSTAHTDFGSYAVSDGSDIQVVAAFAHTHLSNLQNKQTPIQLTFNQSSPGGYHYTFCQIYAGIPVFASDITINVSRKNLVYSIFDDSYDMSAWNVNTTDFSYQEVAAYQAYVKRYFPAGASAAATQVVAYDTIQNAAILCYQVTLRDGRGHMRYVLVSRDGILYDRDGLMYHHPAAAMPPDSMVTGRVNNPDPLTTAGVVYFGPYMGQDSAYQNYNDSCTVQLDTQRVWKNFAADLEGDTFYLNSHYIQLANPEGMGYTPVNSVTPVFAYERCDEGFEDVMVFYHLNTIRSYVNSLGFNSTDTPITADPHFYTADESFFETPDMVCYGTGGVPDAQDADVIVHEYTHFISWNSNHSNGMGSSLQRNGIDEGSGDYDAASYSASIDSYHWYWVFNWDGHNEYWDGRWVNNMTVYPNLPDDPGVTGIWKYAEIWSASMMQLWWEIGRGPADSMFFQALYGLGGNITLLDAAQQYIKADSILFGGRYHCIVTDVFNQHGLAYDPACGGEYPLGTADIAAPAGYLKLLTYPDGFRAVSLQSDAPIDITLYDMSGRQIASYQHVSTEIKPDLPGGVYIIALSSQGYQQGFKWVNLR
jgi:hypothetical protein